MLALRVIVRAKIVTLDISFLTSFILALTNFFCIIFVSSVLLVNLLLSEVVTFLANFDVSKLVAFFKFAFVS